MRIYNSMSNKLEDFKSIKENEVSMYVCGPTVYDDPHIGNARPLIVFDLVYRVFSALGYNVKYVSNYTDIDDKIIDKAMQLNISAKEVADKYINAYEKLSKDLNVISPQNIRVTETIESIINFIEDLIDKGYAYQVDGDVYFRVSKVDDYGKLSKQKVNDLVVGARIEENSLKENPLDFTLWKKTTVGETFSSKFSEGRPGWHTECVVMINESFDKELIDIHGGGLDLKFPHHENEIAQAHSCKNEAIANFWMHNGLINVDGKKMSKSKGKLILAKDMVNDLGYDVVRWLMQSTHYRAPLKLSDEYIEQSQTELVRIYTALNKAYSTLVLEDNSWSSEYSAEQFNKFLSELENDFNTSNAYKVIFDTIKLLNNSLRVKEKDNDEIIKLSNSVVKMLNILGIDFEYINISDEDKKMYNDWKIAIANKDFSLGDKLRNELIEKGMI